MLTNLVVHIDLKIKTENVVSQSNKRSFTEKYDMPVWRKLNEHLRRENVAKKNTLKSRLDVIEIKIFKKIWKVSQNLVKII